MTLDDMLATAREKLAKGLGAATKSLADLEAERDRVPPAYYQAERAQRVRLAQIADTEATTAFGAWQRAALTRARNLRLEAEAAIPPSERVAALTERNLLAADELNAEVYIERAAEMLEAGQWQRAELLLSVAQAKGVSAATSESLATAIEDIRDAKVPERKEAREIWDRVVKAEDDFNSARLRALTDAGLGIAADGSAGNGSDGQRALSNAARKITDYFAAQSRGEAYSAPAGDGVAE